MTFIPAGHGDVLALVLGVAVLLAAARLLGELARRLRQPAVVGEILAGVLLGPSVLGAVAPGVAEWIIPSTPLRGQLLEAVALFGAMLLLAVTGVETDLRLIRRRARTAAGVAAGGLVIPLAAGLALAVVFPPDLVGESSRGVFAMFLATALAISAIPVLASILLEMRLMRRDIGQTMLAAGMIDDIAGWTLLGIVAALAEGSTGLGAVAGSALTVVAFVAMTGLAGPVIVSRAARLVHGKSGRPDHMVTLVVVLIFGWGALSQALNLEPVLGAFAMGILIGRVRRIPDSVRRSLETMALAVFAPIFFAVAGLKVDVRALVEPRLALLTLAVVAVAVAGKVAGAYLGGLVVARTDHWTSLSYGIGLAARGAIGIVVASVGLSLGVLTPPVFSMVVVMAVVTSMLTPPLLAATLRRVVPDIDEARRLSREEASAGGLIQSLHRILAPVRPRPDEGPAVVAKAEILRRLAAVQPMAATVFAASSRNERSQAETAVRTTAASFGGAMEVATRVVVTEDPVRAVVDEAAKGYDLLVIGASETSPGGEAIFGSVVDEMVRLAPVPTLVVRGTGDPAWSPRRILVPTDGTPAAARAAEIAFALAGSDGVVTVLHVVPRETSPVIALTGSDTGAVARLDAAHEITSVVRDMGDAIGVATETVVEMGPEPDEAIISVALRTGVDLIVLGTSIRVGTRRLFLGPRVERILGSCPCPVAVLNS